jgi:hypothetical protein
MTPPPGEGNPFSSSQDAGANPVDAALDRAARIADALLESIGPAESESAPPPEAALDADAPTPVASQPGPPDGIDAAPPAEEPPAETQDKPAEETAEAPVESAPSDEPVEPPAPVVPTEGDVPALVSDAPIEDQLEKIEGLLDEAQAQIGGEAPAKDKADPPPDPADTGPGTSPDEIDAASPEDLLAEPEIRLEDAEPLEDEEEEHEEETPIRTPWPDPDTARGQLILLLQDTLCWLLDRVDRPFVRVSYPARQILGVCALVTLLATVATWLLARL